MSLLETLLVPPPEAAQVHWARETSDREEGGVDAPPLEVYHCTMPQHTAWAPCLVWRELFYVSLLCACPQIIFLLQILREYRWEVN